MIVDLSVALRHGSEGMEVRLQPDPPEYLGHPCYAWDLRIPSHTGTYFETAAHVFRDGITTAEFPPEDLVLPGVCLAAGHRRRAIDARDLDEAARALPGGLPEGRWALLVDAGLREAEEHAYFTRDAAGWMSSRGVRIMGSNTPRYDTGFDAPTGFFVDLFAAGIAIVANLLRLEELPPIGFDLVVMPLSVEGVGTVPCRVAAVVGSGRGATR